MEEDDAAPLAHGRGGQRGRTLPPLLPIRRCFPLDSPFFDEGNEDRDHLTKLASLPLSNPPRPSSSFPPTPSSFFYCNAPHCSSSFSSLSTFHAHYVTTHAHVCGECGWRFGSGYVMRVHQRERHSAMWRVQRDRGEEVGYDCLVETCGWRGKRREGRRVHMVKKHGWDEAFVFDEKPAVSARRTTPTQRRWKQKQSAGEMQADREEREEGTVEEAMEQARPSRLSASPHLRRPGFTSTALSNVVVAPSPTITQPAAAVSGSASARAPALRFAPRQVLLPQPPSRSPTCLPPPASSAPDPSTLPIRTFDYRETDEDGDSDDDAPTTSPRELRPVNDLLMKLDKLDEAVKDEGEFDEAMDAEMSSALASLRAFSVQPQRVPARLTFGHRGHDVRHKG